MAMRIVSQPVKVAGYLIYIGSDEILCLHKDLRSTAKLRETHGACSL